MNLELQTEFYLSQLLDKANELDIEPHFLDVLVCEAMHKDQVTEDIFLNSYFLRLARGFTADSVTGLKSHRPDLVECSRFALQELSDQDLQDLPPKDSAILSWGAKSLEENGKIKNAHVQALAIAREDIEEQKTRYGKPDFASLVSEVFLPHLQPLILQQKQMLEALTDRLANTFGKPDE